VARRMWCLLEPIHAVVYFAPELTDRYRAAGLKGFWMGYFAGRSAAFGAASPEVVLATFFNFHDSMVRRALPDAWSYSTPEAVLRARTEGAGAALRRALGDEVAAGADLAEAAELAAEAAGACSPEGRALFAAHASLQWPEDPVLRLWHAATLLREHRGDGHVAALFEAGVDGLESHVLMVASGAVSRELIQTARGWPDEDWQAASSRLGQRGLVDGAGQLTEQGARLRARVEATTDRLAAGPWEHLGAARTDRLAALLAPMAETVAAADVPYPNAMGLPRPSRAAPT
jgi:hypothetical protein